MQPSRQLGTRRSWRSKKTDNPDVVQVYKNLQVTSLNSHLPAFEACN